MTVDIFSYSNYKSYLITRLNDQSRGGGRGSRAKLSRSLNCHTSFTAQVLRGDCHFSLDAAETINGFLKHNETESEYFILLVQRERAGSESLKSRLKRRLDMLSHENLLLRNRLEGSLPLKDTQQDTYYSSWIYAAMHTLVSIPEYQTVEKIASRLGLHSTVVRRVLDFLRSCSLVSFDEQYWKTGTKRIHLGSDSPHISKHHMNWRLKAIQSIDCSGVMGERNLHYSSVISVSFADTRRIQEILIRAIQKIKLLVRNSREEKLASFCVDFFEL